MNGLPIFRNLSRLVFLLVCAIAASAAASETRNVVLITVDTLRADYVSSNGSKKVQTPQIDSLAGKGVNFLQARSPVPLTLPSHASILTGLYPWSHGVRDNGAYRLPDETNTLAEILKQHGYDTAAFVGSFVLDRRFGLNQGFDLYEDRMNTGPELLESLDAERKGADVIAAFERWLKARNGSRPFFAWIHLYDPHAPYQPPEPQRSQYAADLYAGEVAYADSMIGTALQLLEKHGWLAKSIIAVAGDHGEGLGEHGESTHSVLIYNSTLHVPMVLAVPGLVKPGTRVNALCRTIDLAPTILDYLEISTSLGDGSSLRSMIEGNASRPVVALSESLYANRNLGWSPLKGVESEGVHYIDSPRPELYDTGADPGESRNRIRDRGKEAERMRRLLPAGKSAPEPPRMDPETEERLRSLGYVSGAPAPERKEVNPVEKMEVWNEIQNALLLFGRQKYEEASQQFQSVRRKEPGIPMVYDMLGLCYMRMRRWEEARKVYEEALRKGYDSGSIRLNLGILFLEEKNITRAQQELERALQSSEQSVVARYYLGNVYRESGRLKEAVEQYDRALAINPDYVYAVNGLGVSYAKRNNAEEALRYFRRAVELTPGNAPAQFNLASQLQRMGKGKEAVLSYRKFLDLASGPEFASQRKTAEEAIRTLENKP